MHAKEISEILKGLKATEDAITAGQDPATAIQKARKAAKELREELVGTEDMTYIYDCGNSELCPKKRCHLELNNKLDALGKTFCMDSLSYGDGKFEQTEII
jgi:hypothetical protein